MSSSIFPVNLSTHSKHCYNQKKLVTYIVGQVHARTLFEKMIQNTDYWDRRFCLRLLNSHDFLIQEIFLIDIFETILIPIRPRAFGDVLYNGALYLLCMENVKLGDRCDNFAIFISFVIILSI